jgi:hypothetical protein
MLTNIAIAITILSSCMSKNTPHARASQSASEDTVARLPSERGPGVWVRGCNDESNAEQLKIGIEVEKEHTDDEKLAEKIARDHLAEDPHYYTKLKKAGL